MKNWKKALGVAICGFAAAVSLAGCGGTSDGGAKGKHLNMGLYWFGESLDPANGWDSWTLTRIGAGETLVTVTDKMKFAPQLADKWENISPTTWKLHIRKGVKFSNGDDMTPELVKASLERTLEKNDRAKKLSKIKDIKVDGENLIIETTEPYGSFISSLTEPLFTIMDTKNGDADAATAPVLTGPYAVTVFTKNDEIQMKRNDNYWDGKPKLDTVTVKYVKDDTKRAMALQSGELDLIQRVDAANRSLFENDSYHIFEDTGTRVYLLNVNMDGVLRDDNIRQAVSEMIDYNALAAVEGNGAKPAGAPFPDSVPYGQVNTKDHQDLAAAKANMAKAGYTEKNSDGYYVKDGEPLTLKLAVWGNKTAMYEAFQAQLKQAGVKVDVVHVQEPDMVDSVGGFDLLENNWITASTNDPYWFLDGLFRSDSKSNSGHFNDPEVDRLLKEMSTTFDDNRKNELTNEIVERIMKEKPAYFLVFPANNLVGKSKVTNVPVFPIDYYVMTKDIDVK